MILGNFEQFWKRLSIHPRKCRNTLKKFWLDIDPMVKYGAAEAARVLTQCMVRLTQCLVPPTWYGRVGCGGYAGMRFPFMEKSKLLLNKYFGILHNVICFFLFPPFLFPCLQDKNSNFVEQATSFWNWYLQRTRSFLFKVQLSRMSLSNAILGKTNPICRFAQNIC